MSAHSPDLVSAMRLLDELKVAGFVFARTAPGMDGPLMGRRMTDDFVDFVYIEGFSHDCIAWRQRRSPLVVTGEGLVERRIVGGVLTVLHEVSNWEIES